MRIGWHNAAPLAAALGLCLPAAAQNIAALEEPIEEAISQGPLLPEEVLRSSALTFPSILESFERAAAARSDQLAAHGAFDLILEGEAYDRVTGTFPGGYAEFGARQPIAPFRGEVYGTYRLSDGTFPIYENIFNTNQLGEFKIGGLLSLLRDRRIDSRRFNVEDMRLASNQARLDVLLVQLKVQHEALRAYWYWVAAGQEVAVYEELLEIAEARAVGLTRQFEEGATPRIALTENEQNLIRRKSLLTAARRDFETAATSLSYYLRRLNGELITPTRAQLPGPEVLARLPNMQSLLSVERSEVLANRPELRDFQIALERAQNKVELRENDLQPELELRAELSRDFGRIGDGGPTFDSTDTIVGITLRVPLQRRAARGRLRRAEAELREIKLRERRVADQISVELENILINLKAALRLATLAKNEVEQTDAMVVAERRRFNLGAGNFFLVNVREERAADAQIRQIRANLNGRLAEVSYNTATMDLTALGLE